MKSKRLLGLALIFAFFVSFASISFYIGPAKALDPYDHRTAQFNIVILPDGRAALTHGYYHTFNNTFDDYSSYRISEDTIVYNYTNPYELPVLYADNVTYLTFVIDVVNNMADVSIDFDMEPFSPASMPPPSIPTFTTDVSATYSNGVFTMTTDVGVTNVNITEQMGLTMLIPDFTMSLTMADGEVDGTMTLQPGGFIELSGLTLVVHGERTQITLSGDGNVLYLGDMFNASHLIEGKTLIESLVGPVDQDGTLLNLTDGALNATQASLIYTNTTFPAGDGAVIDLDVTIANTTTGILQSVIPEMIGGMTGDDNVTALIFYGIEKMLNETSGSLTISYDESAETVDLSGTVTLSLGDVLDFMKGPIPTSYWFPPWNVAPILNSDVPYLDDIFDQVEIADVYLDHITSMNFDLDYNSSANTFNATGSASVNNMDTILDDISTALNQTYDYWWWNENVSIVEYHREQVMNPQGEHTYSVQKYSGGSDAIAYYIVNDPSLREEMVWDHIYNLWGELDYTWRQNVTFSFNNFESDEGDILHQGYYDSISGVILEVDLNWVNSSWYDLDDLFDHWIDTSLGTNDTFSVTVSGGSNGTHHTILSTESVVGPPNATVDDPDGNLLTAYWYNTTPDELSGLLFSVAGGGVSGGYIDPNVISENNPFILHDPYLGVRFEITGISNPTGITVGVATDPAAPGGGLTPVGFYVNVTTTSPVTSVEGWITFFYTDAMIEDLGLNEETLEVYWYNTSTSSYEALSPVIRNTEENWVSGYLTHFSVFVLLGLPTGLPLWLILTVVAVVVVAALAVGFVLLRRRTAPVKGKPSTETEGWKET